MHEAVQPRRVEKWKIRASHPGRRGGMWSRLWRVLSPVQHEQGWERNRRELSRPSPRFRCRAVDTLPASPASGPRARSCVPPRPGPALCNSAGSAAGGSPPEWSPSLAATGPNFPEGPRAAGDSDRSCLASFPASERRADALPPRCNGGRGFWRWTGFM